MPSAVEVDTTAMLGTPPGSGGSYSSFLSPKDAKRLGQSYQSTHEVSDELATPTTPKDSAFDVQVEPIYDSQMSDINPFSSTAPVLSLPSIASDNDHKLTRRHTHVGMRNKRMQRGHLRELAKTALTERSTHVGDIDLSFSHDGNLRESIRLVQAYSRRDLPLEEVHVTATHRFRRCEVHLRRDVLTWNRHVKSDKSIDTDDIVGAQVVKKEGQSVLIVHYFRKGHGHGSKALKRKHKTIQFKLDLPDANRMASAIQELVRWQARAPTYSEKRKIKIVVNPHSGKRKAQRIWTEQVKPMLELGNFDCVVEETAYGGHAYEMGREYRADDGFEALVFIGGDGTLCEFMNGLLSRPEHEWREIVATTPMSLISAGTQNAFGTGVGTPTAHASLFCIIKRKVRPLDVVTTVAEKDPTVVHYSFCGVGWGVAGDVAADSEKHRWLGTSRYAWLKIKWALLMPKKHKGKFRYVLTDPQPRLRKYDEIKDEGAEDQFDMEEGNPYDDGTRERASWGGVAHGVTSPASTERYPPEMWTEESGSYIVVGVLNAAPDGAYTHPSDGNLDLVVTRKGTLLQTLHLALLYLVGKELKSPLLSYLKVKTVVVSPEDETDAANIDGEELAGGPWRMEVVPSLFKALSEK